MGSQDFATGHVMFFVCRYTVRRSGNKKVFLKIYYYKKKYLYEIGKITNMFICIEFSLKVVAFPTPFANPAP